MSWKPIVIGVDASPEAAAAAAFGCWTADAAQTTCHLVHAAHDAWSALATVELPERAHEFTQATLAQAREQVLHALWGTVPAAVLERLTIRQGRAPAVLKQAVADLGAELLVLGGKHHSAVGRWLAGSTSLDVARTTEVPLLVTRAVPAQVRRILVAVDLSQAARPTLAAAERYAELFCAELRALSVFEPLPQIPGSETTYDGTEYYRMLEEQLERDVWPLMRVPGAEHLVRYGMAVETILREATEWQADILVVGSHGRGWAERILMGSVTEKLLNHRPTSVLVVPVGAPQGAGPTNVRRRHSRTQAVAAHV